MYAALQYKNRICDLYPGNPRAEQDKSWWEQLGDAFDSLFTSTVTGTGPGDPPPPSIYQLLCTNGTGIGTRNAFEIIELGDHLIQLRTVDGWGAPEGLSTFLSQSDPRKARGPIGLRYVDAPGDLETFHLIPLTDDESEFALQTSYGWYVTAESDGNGSPLTSNRDTIGEWQRFTFMMLPKELEPPPPPTLAERAAGGVDAARQAPAVAQSAAARVAAATGQRPSEAAQTSAAVTGATESPVRRAIFRKK